MTLAKNFAKYWKRRNNWCFPRKSAGSPMLRRRILSSTLCLLGAEQPRSPTSRPSRLIIRFGVWYPDAHHVPSARRIFGLGGPWCSSRYIERARTFFFSSPQSSRAILSYSAEIFQNFVCTDLQVTDLRSIRSEYLRFKCKKLEELFGCLRSESRFAI